MPWVGILVTLVILLSVIGFGVCKRKGSRKPPPIPETGESSRVKPNRHTVHSLRVDQDRGAPVRG